MNEQCPVCQRETPPHALLRSPYLDDGMVALLSKINPAWSEGQPCCRSCFDAARAAAEEAKQQGPRGSNFRSYYRYHLTKREHGQWHHANPDMAKWRQAQIDDKAATMAQDAGFDAWLIFDADEIMVAQGVRTD